MKFKVGIARTETRSEEFEVEAPDGTRAVLTAKAMAANHDYSGNAVDEVWYQDNGAEPCNEAKPEGPLC